ncbi:hypothetical protein [Methanosarcina sp. WH1]|nr:hypothetical protein [Methanosarcina sp. WH1]
MKANGSEPLNVQKKVNGTICCQHRAGEPPVFRVARVFENG